MNRPIPPHPDDDRPMRPAMLRGWRGLRRSRATVPEHSDAVHAPDDPHHVHDAHCGHAHAPTPAQVARLTGWRDTAALVAGVAIRPCTGALFVLILTWQLGIGPSGILAAYAMGLGTALVTLGVAAMAVWAREGTFAALPATGLARAAPVLELAVGAVIAVVALRLLSAAI
jgi:ABC-type nickel/cobalt efflux system permease component RcnA